jgi:hypothetical protein
MPSAMPPSFAAAVSVLWVQCESDAHASPGFAARGVVARWLQDDGDVWWADAWGRRHGKVWQSVANRCKVNLFSIMTDLLKKWYEDFCSERLVIVILFEIRTLRPYRYYYIHIFFQLVTITLICPHVILNDDTQRKVLLIRLNSHWLSLREVLSVHAPSIGPVTLRSASRRQSR